MLKIVLENDKDHGDLFCPQFWCDVCGEQITDLQAGHYVWNMHDLVTNMLHVHRRCHGAVVAQHPDWLVGWEYLRTLLDYLRNGMTDTGVE